jgi:hypothetical protein
MTRYFLIEVTGLFLTTHFPLSPAMALQESPPSAGF